jgi:hypothetical protein
MKRAISLIVGIAAVCAVAVAPAGAAPSVSLTGASRSGAIATVSGTALFEAGQATSVGGTNTDFARVEVADAAGVNLTDAKIQPLANGLRFIWELNSMPAQVPPEGVRYTWAFSIGTNAYQLQAKRSNVASITTFEDPLGHARHIGSDFFQLRGACQASYEGAPVAGCYHLAWLTGSFDIANKRVTVDLPYETKDELGRVVAPDFKPGVVLTENQQATMSITAAFQAVVGNTSTSDFTNGWTEYFVNGVVQLAVGTAGQAPENQNYTQTATLSGGNFTGTISGLTTSKNTVYVRACQAQVCSYTSVVPASL